MLTMGPNKLYTLQEIPGKGLGLVAAAKIVKGTRILSEDPLLMVAAIPLAKQDDRD